jgi:hypothetical protein
VGQRASVLDLVDSATSYLLYECDVELLSFKRKSDLCEYLEVLAARIAGRVREEEVVVTEIDCVAK